jgi:hypothetical protein
MPLFATFYLSLLGFFASVLSISAQTTETSRHLFILSGQSNMTSSLEKGFSETVSKSLGKEKVTIVKHSRSGRGIRFWVRDYKLPDTHPMSKLSNITSNGEEYPRLIEAAQGAGKASTFASVCFVWMQGESDANRGLAIAYEKSFLILMNQLKKDLEIEKLYFVIGRISDWGLHGEKTADNWKAMRAVQVKLAEDSKYGAWVDTDDLIEKDHKKPQGNLHYTRENGQKLGSRLAQKALNFLQK